MLKNASIFLVPSITIMWNIGQKPAFVLCFCHYVVVSLCFVVLWVFCCAASFVVLQVLLCFWHSMMLHWTQMLLPLWVLCFVVLWVLCACKCGCMWCCTGRKCCDHTAHKHWTFLLQLFPLLLLRLGPSLSSSQETQIKVFFSQLHMLSWPSHLPTSHNYTGGYFHVKHV